MINGHYTRKELKKVQDELVNSDIKEMEIEVVIKGKKVKYIMDVEMYRKEILWKREQGYE